MERIMYWDAVLKEVLNKDKLTDEFSVTNINAYKVRETIGSINRNNQQLPRKTLRKYFLGEKYPGIYLTEREAQTIGYFLRGKTTVEVAAILKLSRRTVEFYLKNMKIKLNCRLKSELITKVHSSDLLAQLNLETSQIMQT